MENCIITKEAVQNIIEKRDREIHKGDCGRILIVAGSQGMAGAAVLVARAALRSGSGLVQVAIPKELFPIVQIGVPEATCLDRDFSKLELSVYDAVCVGPGLGKSTDSVGAVKYLIENYDGKMVMDADALNIVAEHDLFEMMRAREARCAQLAGARAAATVITPHVGEARRLLGDEYDLIVGKAASDTANCTSSVDDSASGGKAIGETTDTARERIALALAAKTGAVTVLKGHASVVATTNCKTYTNTTGNPGMATAGSGDVLSGIITGLMGQKRGGSDKASQEQEVQGGAGVRFGAVEAAVAGVYVHGMAGDLAAEALGEYGLIAGDIAYYAAIALKEILV